MVLEQDRYTYHVAWSEEDGEYVGLCLEFPSLSWLANTPEGALQGIRHVVAEVVLDLKKEEEPTERVRVSSSDLISVGYYPKQQILEIEFLSGEIYQYFNVPDHVYRGLLTASSYFDVHIQQAGYLHRTKLIR